MGHTTFLVVDRTGDRYSYEKQRKQCSLDELHAVGRCDVGDVFEFEVVGRRFRDCCGSTVAELTCFIHSMPAGRSWLESRPRSFIDHQPFGLVMAWQCVLRPRAVFQPLVTFWLLNLQLRRMISEDVVRL